MKDAAALIADLVAAKQDLVPYSLAFSRAAYGVSNAVHLAASEGTVRAALACMPTDPDALATAAALAEEVPQHPKFGAALATWLSASREFNERLERLERARAALDELSATETN
jgi:hypothetical protein